MDPQRINCYHEAGHAVAAVHFGWPVDHVVVGLTGEYAGRVVPAGTASDNPRVLRQGRVGNTGWDPRPELAVLGSGRWAVEELLYLDGMSRREACSLALSLGADHDFAQEVVLTDMAVAQGTDRGDVAWWQAWRDLLAGPLWPAVEKVAAELGEYGRVDGAWVKSIVEGQS